MPANYDRIAVIYDLLSRLVFGKAIIRAQAFLIGHIPEGSKILIVGGGTGWILEKIAEKHPQRLEIDYIDSSAQMIALSQKRNYGSNKVNFIHLPIEEYQSSEKYDVIITPFIFDNFKEEKVNAVFAKLDALLRKDGLWLFADFTYDKSKGPWWQGILLWTMYFFFRLTSGIETRELVNMDSHFLIGYRNDAETFQCSGFIRSAVYRKV